MSVRIVLRIEERRAEEVVRGRRGKSVWSSLGVRFKPRRGH
jgi:hypothetical protein